MKRSFFCLGILCLFFSSCTEDRSIKTAEAIIIDPDSELIYYWNFNTVEGDVTEVNPNFSLPNNTGAQITYPGTGIGKMDIDTDGYITNTQNNDPAETLLKVRNPSNTRNLIFDLPTTGYRKVVLQFATARSNNGATTQNYSYSTDGTTYTNMGLVKNTHNPATDPTPPLPNVDLVTLDFSAIDAVNDKANFKVKIQFSGDAAFGDSGNNRFDNVTLKGIPNLP